MQRFDDCLIALPPRPHLSGFARVLAEFVFFGMKEARACLLAGLFFVAVFAVPRDGLLGIPRYDVLLILAFVLIGFFIWLAENISTFFAVWSYPDQLGAWSAVHVAKWSSWSLLVTMTFTIVANLEHIKATIRVPD